jgi:peptidoglycan/xylan/chitin deacetylase (PgdA/CDA1 family)
LRQPSWGLAGSVTAIALSIAVGWAASSSAKPQVVTPPRPAVKVVAAARIVPPPLPTTPPLASANVPILIYHKPPPDFDTQMAILQQRGYTTITLDQMAAAMQGHGDLPTKPVIITFDDGFEAQQAAVPYLESHRLKATFFIIDGGAASDYCIGANRTNASCGDAYMHWDEIRQLDHNPLFTIGSHTVDHLDLAAQTPAVQWFEIDEGKLELQQELGHSVDDFAYPDGGYTATTLALVRQAGFVAAVTTDPGTIQSASGLLTLSRIRSTYALP